MAPWRKGGGDVWGEHDGDWIAVTDSEAAGRSPAKAGSKVIPGSLPLDRARIVAETLRLLDAHGAGAFSIRKIAQSLGVTPMALYHHVRNKAELAKLVVDKATSDHVIDEPTGDWREDLWVVALWMRQSSLAHPALADLRRTYAVWTPSILTLTNRWVASWRQSGLPLTAALLAAHASSRAVIGLVAAERAIDAADVPSGDLLETLPDAGLLLTPIADDLRLFEISVRALIDGLFRHFAHPKGEPDLGEDLWKAPE